MLTMKIKNVDVRFVAQSDECEIYCRDGEIVGRVDATAAGGDQGDDDNKGKYNEVTAGAGGSIHATLPPGIRNLLVAGERLIVKADDGRLLSFSGENYSTRRVLGHWDVSSSGELLQAVEYGNIVTLIGEKRLAWLITSAAGDVSYRTTLPAAPECELTLSPELLSPYISNEGDTVSLDIVVPTDADKAPYNALASWIEGGDGRGVTADVREEIYRSVAEGVGAYLSAVSACGMVTAPVMGFASLSGRLPGECQRVGEYQQPRLWIESWNYIDGVLRMSLRLTAVPCRPYAAVEVTEDNVIWSDIFGRIDIALSEPVRWWEMSRGDGVRVTGLGNITYRGERKRGFMLYSKSESEYNAVLSGNRSYKPAGSVSASTAVAGSVRLRRDNDSADVYPDYSDHDRLRVTGGIATAEGPVLHAFNRIFTAHREFPVLYPVRNSICDADIIRLSESFRRRSATRSGRTPLLAFCNDGVRLVSSSGDGGYGLSQLLSRDVLSGRDALAVTDTSVVYMTVNGLVQQSAGKRKLLLGRSEADIVIADVMMRYSIEDDFVVMISGERGMVYQCADGKPGSMEIVLSGICECKNQVWGVDEHGHLMDVRLERRRELSAGSDLSDGLSGSSGSDLVTRALKLGDPYNRKRIRSLLVYGECESWQLDGCDRLDEWERVCSGTEMESGRLWLPAFRYWRIRLSVPDSTAIPGVTLRVEYPS
ncbi:MAG: hypothetical protein K2H86_08930 [Muribaculaceae bacterium]|nr:hypothetical protein [Muribaculaceae bacterium]